MRYTCLHISRMPKEVLTTLRESGMDVYRVYGCTYCLKARAARKLHKFLFSQNLLHVPCGWLVMQSYQRNVVMQILGGISSILLSRRECSFSDPGMLQKLHTHGMAHTHAAFVNVIANTANCKPHLTESPVQMSANSKLHPAAESQQSRQLCQL